MKKMILVLLLFVAFKASAEEPPFVPNLMQLDIAKKIVQFEVYFNHNFEKYDKTLSQLDVYIDTNTAEFTYNKRINKNRSTNTQLNKADGKIYYRGHANNVLAFQILKQDQMSFVIFRDTLSYKYKQGDVDTFYIDAKLYCVYVINYKDTVTKEVTTYRDSIHIDTISPGKITIVADTIYVNGKPLITRDTTIIKAVLKYDTTKLSETHWETTVTDKNKNTFWDSTYTKFPILTLDFRKTNVEETPMFKMFPQPASNYLNLEENETGVTLFDVNGIELLYSKDTILDLSFLPNGTYFVKYKDEFNKLIIRK